MFGNPVLREAVVSQFAKQARALGDMSLVSVSPLDMPEADVWAACTQYSMDATTPLRVIIRDAERLDLTRVLRWLEGARLQPLVSLLFVCAWDRWPKDSDGEALYPALREKFKGSTVALLADCSFPRGSEARSRAQTEALGFLSPLLMPADCRLVVEHSLLDFTRAVQAARLIEVLRTRRTVRVSKPVLDQLLPSPSEDDFVSALLHGDTVGALAAAESASPAQALARLARDLPRLAALSRARTQVRTGEVGAQMAKVSKLGHLPRPFVVEYWRAAHRYERPEPLWGALFRADAELFRGFTAEQRETARPSDTRGVLETLTLEWHG